MTTSPISRDPRGRINIGFRVVVMASGVESIRKNIPSETDIPLDEISANSRTPSIQEQSSH